MSVLAVWKGTSLGETPPEDFNKFWKEQGFDVSFLEEIYTEPNKTSDGIIIKGTGGRSDIFFEVQPESISTFAVHRLRYGGEISWYSDVIANTPEIYSKDTLNKYKGR